MSSLQDKAAEADGVGSEFEGIEIETSGSLVADVFSLARIFAAVNAELLHVDIRLWLWLDATEPMDVIRKLAAQVEAIRPQLAAQGFAVPTTPYAKRPATFLAEQDEFLTRVMSLVAEPPVVH